MTYGPDLGTSSHHNLGHFGSPPRSAKSFPRHGNSISPNVSLRLTRCRDEHHDTFSPSQPKIAPRRNRTYLIGSKRTEWGAAVPISATERVLAYCRSPTSTEGKRCPRQRFVWAIPATAARKSSFTNSCRSMGIGDQNREPRISSCSVRDANSNVPFVSAKSRGLNAGMKRPYSSRPRKGTELSTWGFPVSHLAFS